MKRYRYTMEGMEWRNLGSYILFTDHEASIKQAVEKEREACAKACDDLRANRPATEKGLLIASECATAIRSRSQQGE